MPIICIGPVCIPITAIIPIILFIFKPIYVRLPKEYQEKIDYGVKQCQLAMNRCLRRIGWSKPKKKDRKKNDDLKKDTNDNNSTTDKSVNDNDNDTSSTNDGEKANDQNPTDGEDDDDGELIKEMQDEDEWDKLMNKSISDNLVFIAYFTSPWCKPCKKFYPVFEELCTKSQSNLKFIKVDIDEFDEIALEYKVSTLPTFMRFKNGKQSGSVRGPNKAELQELFMLN
mmetsp:Transcript_58453/g.52672  ORF Transcript_58453/g.52672 Transcript_58453/m.52672 type:complete len:227 (-) Transcript_58453:38-718(-)